ncbi:hypothetical protein BJ138DRAFT_1114439 [Hygrophoropsis aurantiaca]|uniref:Uncharacterized protein n=1 Tax=Hygrophoropsis aurantiaca TaxID=72124 RepID=A0ACB8AAE8_9AGAM|nr:hypothetical protein BJ138DRAFT_1114439 [Hygrophoropsis aurantiaca]
MDTNVPVLPRPLHIDSAKLSSGSRAGLPETALAAQTPSHRGPPRYKEKFQALRERYDQVTALHEEYQRDLKLANERMQKLQAENDLLLDAISIALPTTPSLRHPARPSPRQPPPPERHQNGYSSVANGAGRYPPMEPRDMTPGEYIPHETNGR